MNDFSKMKLIWNLNESDFKKNQRSFGAFMGGLNGMDLFEMTLNVFENECPNRFKNECIYMHAMKGIAKMKDMDRGMAIHDEIEKHPSSFHSNPFLTAFIDMHGCLGNAHLVSKLMNRYSNQIKLDVIALNACMHALNQCGHFNASLSIFSDRAFHFKDNVSYLCALQAITR